MTTTRNSVRNDPPASSVRRSQPPPLPESASRIAPRRALADAALVDSMFERLAASDYTGALIAAEALLLHQPQHADALDCAKIARSELRKVYVGRLGSLDRVPALRVAPQGLPTLSLDFRAGFLLARIDKKATLRAIVDSSGLPALDALRMLSELYLQRVIGFDHAAAQ